jgi:hypothetical protein
MAVPAGHQLLPGRILLSLTIVVCKQGEPDMENRNDWDPAPTHRQPKYPIGTVATYGPDDKRTTKIAAGVILHEGAEIIIKRVAGDDLTIDECIRAITEDPRFVP